MNKYNLLLALLVFHYGIIVIFLILYLITGKTILRREHILPLVMIPIFGLWIGLGIQLVQWVMGAKKKPVELESMRLGGDIYWRSLRKPTENFDIVPLEETIQLNSYNVRRRILLDALFDDPTKHIDVLMVARNNEDAETAHYAATTIDKIHHDFQLEIQKYQNCWSQSPNDEAFLSEYINLLEKYIQSGLLRDHMVERQRKVLSELLEQKLVNNPNDKQMLFKKISNDLALKHYTSCLEASRKLRLVWPHDEDTWIESLRICVEAGDQENFQEVLAAIHQLEINWSKQSRDQISYWTEGLSFG